jgi:K+-sensing histidine kinase KdpD
LSYNALLKIKVTDTKVAELLEKQGNAAESIQHQIEFMQHYEDLGLKAPEWIPVSEMIRKAVSSLDSGVITITINTEGLVVYADSMLEKVFYNLTENAISHGKKVTEIRFWHEKSGDSIIIFCQDDGYGISPSEKDKIFNKGSGKNTGLGLFISKEILDITDMSISETGEYGKGARFEIAVPKGLYRLCTGLLAGAPLPDQLSAGT